MCSREKITLRCLCVWAQHAPIVIHNCLWQQAVWLLIWIPSWPSVWRNLGCPSASRDHYPSYPRPRHRRTLGKGAVRERECASDGHDGLGPRRVIGLECCCQDKQLCLCLGQVFHSVSAYWEHPNQYQPPFMAECVCAGLCLWIEGTDCVWNMLYSSAQFFVVLCLLFIRVCVFLGSVLKWKIWRWWCRIWSLRPSRLWTVWRKEYSCLTCFSTCLDERSFSHTLSLQFSHTLSPPLKPCTLSDCCSS